MLVLEAVLGGAEDVQIKVADGWICVGADVDWLQGLAAEAFTGFAPFTAGGPNGVTSEFFPVVFSPSVATATRSGVQLIKGASVGPLAGSGDRWERVVAFELTTDQEATSPPADRG
jgi:hypothetical protein